METVTLTPAGGMIAADASDAALIGAAKHGQSQAFDRLMANHRERVLRHCYRRGLSEPDAHDVAQDVFVKVYRYLDRYDDQNCFSTWLYRVTENTCIDHLRSQKRRGLVFQRPPVGEDGMEMEFEGAVDSPDESMGRDELAEKLACALDTLSPLLRQPFEMKELEGLRYREIATRLSCTVGTVKSRIFRARRQLCAELRMPG